MRSLPTACLAMLALSACLSDRARERGRDRDDDGYLNIELGGLDCDDSDPAVHPGAPERCGNGVDDNCDGFVDDRGEGERAFYADVDGDGFASSSLQVACEPPGGAHFDLAAGVDCDDTNAAVSPVAAEIWYDGVDDDCDGNDGDRDGDGFTAATVGGRDCDDGNNEVNPDSVEICNNGLDDNCDDSANHCGLEELRGPDDVVASIPVTLPSAVELADVNGDGVDDVIVARDGRISAYLGPLEGLIPSGQVGMEVFGPSIPNDVDFQIVDLDGLGTPEWVIGDRSSNRIAVWWNPEVGRRQLAMLPSLLQGPTGYSGSRVGERFKVVTLGSDRLLLSAHDDVLVPYEPEDTTYPAGLRVFAGPFRSGLTDSFDEPLFVMEHVGVVAFGQTIAGPALGWHVPVLASIEGALIPGIYAISFGIGSYSPTLEGPYFWDEEFPVEGLHQFHQSQNHVVLWTFGVGTGGFADLTYASIPLPAPFPSLGPTSSPADAESLPGASIFSFQDEEPGGSATFGVAHCGGSPFGEWVASLMLTAAEDGSSRSGMRGIDDPEADWLASGSRWSDTDLWIYPQCGDVTGDGVIDVVALAIGQTRVVVVEGTHL